MSMLGSCPAGVEAPRYRETLTVQANQVVNEVICPTSIMREMLCVA